MTTISTALTATVVWTTGSLTITADGSINGADGISASGSLGQLVNGGFLTGAAFQGVVNTGSITTVINNGGISDGTAFVNGLSSAQPGSVGVFTNNGAIASSANGIVNSVNSTITTLVNDGSIASQGAAIVNQGTIGSFTNAGIILAKIDNAGSIGSFTNTGSFMGGFIEDTASHTFISSFINSGTIKGDLDFSNDSFGTGTIINSGTITGSITLGSNNDTLTIKGAGSVTGDILASANGTDVVALDPGAGKTFTPQGYLGNLNGVKLAAVNLLSGAYSTDLFYYGAASIDFAGADTSWILSNHISSIKLANYTLKVSGFGGGDLIYLPDTVANAAILGTNGQLVLTENGTTVATFALTGTYAGATFQTTAHGNGTDLTVTYTVASAIGNAAGFTEAAQVVDTAQNVQANLGGLETLAAAGKLGGITLTDANPPTLTVTGAQLVGDAQALDAVGGSYTLAVTGAATADSLSTAVMSHIHSVAVTDSAANISKDLDALQSYAAVGKLSGITLTDSGFGTIALSSEQLSADSAALNEISGNFVLSVSAATASQTIIGSATHGTTAVFSGTASEYSITTSGNQVLVIDTGTGRPSSDHLSGVTALQFSDHTVIVAQTPGTSSVTSGNVTELYAAVFGRLPDVPGLNYYEAMLAANPSTPLTQLAQSFLASPEYVNNPNHAYTLDTAGDTKFIDDSYQNLLGRAPESGAVPYYLNLIATLTQGAAPGTAAYTAAEAYAHAVILTDFSASAEFLGDVTITGQNPASAKHWLILTS